MATTFDYTGSVQTHDVSGVDEVHATLLGPGGENGANYDGYNGGDGGVGGRLEGVIDVSGVDQLEIYVGGGNGNTWGYYDGGAGGTSSFEGDGGDGGGQTAIYLPDGTFIARSDAGGGGAGAGNSSNEGHPGGGGAGGGLGGSGGSGANDAGGSGDGGDGGDASFENGLPGGDGGQGYDSGVFQVETETTGGGNTGNGQVVLESLPAAPTGLSVDAIDANSADLSWTDNATDEDEYRVYRDTSAGIDPAVDTPIATLAADTVAYTDTGLDDGTTYHWLVTAANIAGEATSSEVSSTTTLPAPTGFGATAVDSDTVDLAWTDNATDEDGYRVYRDLGSGPVEIANIAAGSTAYTDAAALDGRAQTYHVEVYTADVTETSNTDTATTPIPEVSGFSLDASIQSELTADITDILDNGHYRARWKRSEAADYDPADEVTVAYDADPLETTLSNLLDGEQYDVGIRTETADVTGTYHTATEITKLVAAGGVATANVTETSLDLSWTVNSDFDGSQQIWRDREGYDFDDDRGELVATVSSTATSYSESDTLHPSTDYTYTVTATTQYVYADSPEHDVTTVSAGLEQHPVPPRGWHVEIDHPSGTVLTPSVLDGAERRPRINEQPEFEIPVPRSETWLAEALEEAPMRVWKDGQRQPIDTLADVEVETGRAVLHARGGKFLERRIQEDVIVEPTTEFVERVIAENTPYITHADQPETDETEAIQQDIDSQDEWESVTGTSGLSRIPATVASGTLTLQDACDARDALRDYDNRNANSFKNADRFNGGQAFGLANSGDFVEFDITWPYHLLADSVGIKIREEFDTTDIRFLWDGVVIDESDSAGVKSLSWIELGDGSFYTSNGGYQAVIGEDLVPGETHTLRIESPSNGGSVQHYIDCVAVYDQRYGFNFPNPGSENNGGELPGPQLKPDAVDVRLEAAHPVLSVIGGTLEATIDDTSGAQAVAVTNAGDGAFVEEANSDTVSATWGDAGAEIRARFTLARYGSQSEFPTSGAEGQTVDSFGLSALLDDTPLVINQTFDGDIVDILAGVAENSDSIWELTFDDAAGEIALEWTQPGQRSGGGDLDVVDYTVRKIPSNIQRAVVHGAAQPVREEAVTVSIGEAVALDESDLVPGTDRVVDADGVRYRRDIDYQLNRLEGTITAIADGSLQDGDGIQVDYEYKTTGTFETPEYSDDTLQERVETISSLTSERSCGQAAKVIIDQASAPLVEADVQLPPSIPTDLSLIEALDLEDVPGDALAIYENRSTGNGLQLRMGARERVRDTVERIERRVEAASRRV